MSVGLRQQQQQQDSLFSRVIPIADFSARRVGQPIVGINLIALSFESPGTLDDLSQGRR